MMHGREKSDLAIVAMKPANKANEPAAEASTGANAAEPVERRAGAKGNAHQQSTHWTQSQVRVSQALARIRQLVPSHTRGRSRMRESRTYGSVRGACDETHVPTATEAPISGMTGNGIGSLARMIAASCARTINSALRRSLSHQRGG